MPETRRIVLIASGISLLVVILVPALVCAAMMSGGMSGMDVSNGDMDAMRGMAWRAGGVVLLFLIAGVVLLSLGIRQR